MLSDAEVERALVVCAHPDDVDFGAAGTVAAWTDAGIEVSYCLVTDGDAGGFDPAVPRSDIGPIRRAEQTAAAKEVGVTDLHWLGFPDGYLTVSLDLRKAIARVIRQVRPQRIITQSPDRNYLRVFASHPDHLAAGEATLCAVYPDARNEFWMPDLVADEGLAPWSVSEVWLMSAPEPNRFVDVTSVIDRKIAALRRHVSQNTDSDEMADRLKGWLAMRAETAGMPAGTYAEGFFVVDTAG